MADIEKGRQHRDSSHAEFNKIKPYFFIKLEVNKQETELPKNAKLYATFRNSKFTALDLGNKKFEFKNLADSLQFTLEWDTIKVSTSKMAKVMFEHGASIKFGYYNNILALRAEWKSSRKNEDYDESSEMPRPYMMAIKDKRLIRAAKRNKILPIEFTVFNPIVYGDGIVLTTQTIRVKK